ncbi:MAG: leucyl aminopeptidase [Nitrospirae bacterium]|nr:MAG: leucyl aminopeptidase [Nitrospirota bacterium]
MKETMEITVRKGRIEDESADAVLLIHCEGERRLAPEAAAVDARLRGRLAGLIESGEFTGRLNQVSILHRAPNERLRAKRVVLAGLGKRKDASLDRLRQAAGSAAKAIRNLDAKSFAVPVHDPAGFLTGAPAAGRVRDVAQALAEGALLGLYQFTTYRTERKDDTNKAVRKITVVVSDPRALAQARQGVRQGQVTGEAGTFVRDLCNHPANVVTPTYIANAARKIAKERGVRVTVLDRPQMQRLGMGALLGVARGSHEPPKFVILEYRGGPRGGRPVALVGKTVTFDSGGISLKPADNMEQMKADMTGGAAVLAAVRAAARLRLPINIVALIPATENMPGGSATKPGDVLTSLSGKTIEVINTDAEGRLILADGLTYANRYKPSVVVDIATLTGACVVALGTHAIGVLGNNERLIGELKTAGEQCGERAWQLPLWEEYYEQIKSDVADVKNTGGRPGGTITAAAFLSKFVGDAVWAHLDIASTDWSDRDRAYIQKGATGVGTRLLIQFLSNRANGKRA